jgi:hypothetical protein
MVLHFFLWLALIPMGPGAVSTDIERHTNINKLGPDYATMEECESEATRVLHDMQLSYPDDKSLNMYCTDNPHPLKKEHL